jgi:hypothetical protein
MKKSSKNLTLGLAALVACATAHSAVVLVDFGNAKADPTDPNWNSGITVAGSGTYDLIDTTGATTGIDISFSGGISDSTSGSDHSETRTDYPAWSDSSDLVLQDRVWQTSGTTGTMTISGLSSGNTYSFELFSGYAFGSAGRNPVDYQMTDNGGLVEGFHVETTGVDYSFGTTVTWYTHQTHLSSPEDPADYAGWIGWYDMTPNASGEITLFVNTNGGSNSRGALNAMQITVVPEPSSYAALAGLLTLGVVFFRRRREKRQPE